MMSSEEDAECFGLYGDKLLKKAKRTRQRVDAGEPRNSYSSIPNFSSRPSFLSSGLYGAIFSQSHQHFGLFGPGFGPAKMLNELLGRQMKQAADAATPNDNMMTMDSASSDGQMNFDCLNATSVIRRGLDEDGSPPPGDIAHHMLRDILQGRRKELLSLEQELRASVGGNSGEVTSQDNNNIINNNNNNEVKTSGVASGVIGGDSNEVDGGVSESPAKPVTVNGGGGSDTENDINSAEDEASAAAAMEEALSEAGVLGKQEQAELMEDALNSMNGGGASDSEASMASPASEPLVQPKLEVMDGDVDKDESPGVQTPGQKPEQMELKRARVENIVSTMRSSPVLPLQVNGCKKRKLYHPQQHDNSAAERFNNSSFGLNIGLGLLGLDDDEDLEPVELKQKRVEKNVLKSQLRTMQEQLAEMQQKYVQLCTRMEQESDCQDTEDVPSDLDQDANSLPMPDKSNAATPTTTLPAIPVKDSTPVSLISTAMSQSRLSPAVSKLVSAKLHGPPPGHPLLSQHPHPMNGGLSLVHQPHGPHHDLHQSHGPMPHPQHHHAISNAAAMYLGVSHKLFLEQEARLAKDAAVAAAAVAAEQHHHQQKQQQHHQQQQQQQQHQQLQQQQQQHQQQQQQQQQNQQQQMQQHNHHPHHQTQMPKTSVSSDFSERFSMFRNNVNTMSQVSGTDLEGLADVLKTEITASLTSLIDSIVARFVHQRRFLGKQSEVAAAAAEQLNKDLMMASQLLDRKSPRTKVIDRAAVPGNAGGGNVGGPRVNGNAFPSMNIPQSNPNNPNNNNSSTNNSTANNSPENNINTMNLSHIRPSPTAMFQPPKPPNNVVNSAAAAALYSSMQNLGGPHMNPFCLPENREGVPEQNEALSLVVTPKKKRHKVTDTRITPRTVSRILAQDGMGQPGSLMEPVGKYGLVASTSGGGGGADSPPPRPYHPPPPPMLPVSLPTSVAIPNPSLHESQVFSPYSPFYTGPHHGHGGHPHHMASSSPPGGDPRDSPSLQHPPTLLHPALLAAAQHGGSPDYGHLRASSGMGGNDSIDRNSDCNSADGPYDGMQPSISFGNKSMQPQQLFDTLTPMHLRKAKLMFFWVRYPSSAVLKMYFPDIKFNKNNTAQLVKWFSNFREFYYIQMEKYARQAVSEGIKNAEDLHVGADSEIYRVLNLHYNRNNHIEVWGPQVPSNFRFVVEQTLREFFKAIQTGKDTEQSWKKSIYKVISRLDDSVPEYFKSPNFLEQLE